MAEQTTSDQKEKPNDEPLPSASDSTAVVPKKIPHLEFTESKQEIGTRLTSLISTFRDEAEQQDEILSGLQKEALNNPNFGNRSMCTQWTNAEVCHWLASIDLQDYVDAFYRSSIDGTILLNDTTEESLTNDLNVKPIHCNKLLREIESLKKHSTETLDSNDANLSDIIATIKKENEELLSELQRQKSLNTELNTNNEEFHSIPKQINADETTDDKALREIIESQNKMIEDLSNELQQLQIVSNKKMKELEKKNKKLQDGYIQIETHYQKQLEHSRVQSKSLRAQISSMNDGDNNGQIGLLWAENEYTAKDLENEREKRIMLEGSLKTMQINLNREQQKRKLLESQTSRLTAELTKYLTTNAQQNKDDNATQQSNGTHRRFSRFKLNKNKNKHNAKEVKATAETSSPRRLTVNESKLRRKPSMDAKAGWLKFLSSAGGMGDKLNNIQHKWSKGKSDDSAEEDKEIETVTASPQRRKTLGETVLNTFQKIQNAAHQKIQKKNINYDDAKFVDIADVVIGNGTNGMDKDDHDYVADEDSSAEEAHQIVVTQPIDKENSKQTQREREDSLARKGDGAIALEFTPDMVALPQVTEPDASV
eukprot:220554_1